MKISVILAHPDPASFNAALAEAACSRLRDLGHEVWFHDLYREDFDPLVSTAELASTAALDPTLQRYCDEIVASDGIVLVHPNWWGQPPAMMKGWVDRVLRAGVAYRFLADDQGEGVPAGLLKARAAVILNTSNTPATREREVFGDPLGNLWDTCILRFCGVERVRRRMFGVIVTSSAAQRQQWLAEAADLLRAEFPER